MKNKLSKFLRTMWQIYLYIDFFCDRARSVNLRNHLCNLMRLSFIIFIEKKIFYINNAYLKQELYFDWTRFIPCDNWYLAKMISAIGCCNEYIVNKS